MTTIFRPKGPNRFMHQKRGLKKLIQTGGIAALLFDPGLGKTAVVLDYASILALKAPTQEVRVLVVAPLAAIDTWVMQALMYVSDDVYVWAEALGGSIMQRAEALSSRGGTPRPRTPDRGPKNSWQGPRAAHWHRSILISTRPDIVHKQGPDGLPKNKPRLIIEVTNLDTFASRHRVGSGTMADVMVDAVRRYAPDLVVVDESHKIKGVGANASRALSRVTDFAKRRVLLTGTVMPHSPLDVFAQWRFLQPYAFGERMADGTVKRATFGQFKDRYAKLGGWMGKEVIGFENLDDLQDIMAENAIVARKAESLPDLPKMTTVSLPVLLTAAEKKAYKDMADSLAVSLPTVQATATNRLVQMLRLRQITSGFLSDDNGVMRTIGQSKVNTIRNHVADTLTSENRIVIFAFFTDDIRLLAQAMEGLPKEQKAEVMVISGQTSSEERILLRKRFGSDDPQRMIMIAQIKTMSLAVNELVTASHCIFSSLSQQRDDIIQAIDRLNRLGQTRPVTAWFALAPGTVDEVIMKAHRDRTSLEDAMLQHITQVHEQRELAQNVISLSDL